MPGTGGCRGEVPRKSQTAPPGENPECWEPRMRTGLAEGRQYLATHPLCVRCMAEGRYTKATVVDHIKPHRGDSALFWDQDNWQALCKRCHDRKTWTEDSKILYEY